MFGEGSWNEQENYLQIIMHIEIEVKTCKLSPKKKKRNKRDCGRNVTRGGSV